MRPIPGFTVEDVQARDGGVTVRGPYTEADVAAALALVRARTSQWLSSVDPPQEALLDYQCGEIGVEALPADRMEVYTARDREQMHSSGNTYFLARRRGVWAIHGTSGWVSG